MTEEHVQGVARRVDQAQNVGTSRQLGAVQTVNCGCQGAELHHKGQDEGQSSATPLPQRLLARFAKLEAEASQRSRPEPGRKTKSGSQASR